MRLGAFYKTPQYLSIRRHSYHTSFSHIKEDLLSRPPNIIKELLSPTNSKTLTEILSTILPASGLGKKAYGNVPGLKNKHWYYFPQGHHLVYFPPGIPSDQLLPDGTDTLHYPGAPFERRMWAGGSVTFNDADPLYDRINEYRRGTEHAAICTEKIRNVEIKGLLNDEKIFVEIERCIQGRSSMENKKPNMEPFSILETRTLVFMRAKDDDQNTIQSTSGRFVKRA